MAATISVAPADSLTGVMRLATLVGVFLLAVQLGRPGHRARRFILVLAATGLAYAAYGLLMHLGGFDMVLWWERWAYRDSVTSTFVNRNHYATYAGLGMLCGLGALLISRSEGTGSWTLWLTELLERHWWLVLATTLIFLALVLSHSRAGLLVAGIGVIVLFTALAYAGELRMKKRYGWLLAAVFAGLFMLIGGNTWERIGAFELDGVKRDEVVLISGAAIAQAPAIGYGLGTFADVFALHRDARAGDKEVWRQAHNDYVEMALELGVPATAMLILGLSFPVVACVRALRRRRRGRVYPAIGIAATSLVGVHALVDFSLQTQGVAITYAALLGVAYAQSWSSREF